MKAGRMQKTKNKNKQRSALRTPRATGEREKQLRKHCRALVTGWNTEGSGRTGFLSLRHYDRNMAAAPGLVRLRGLGIVL